VSDGRWILIVDDDDDIREALSAVLAMNGYQTAGAGDGLAALEQIRARGRPALVLLDLRMPRLNGYDFARALHEDPALASIPIVVLSGDLAAIDQAQPVGARGCLRKPIELRQLLDAVRGHVPVVD
jgi:two-component system response regulator MprA